jgi:hypothetical protein
VAGRSSYLCADMDMVSLHPTGIPPTMDPWVPLQTAGTELLHSEETEGSFARRVWAAGRGENL